MILFKNKRHNGDIERIRIEETNAMFMRYLGYNFTSSAEIWIYPDQKSAPLARAKYIRDDLQFHESLDWLQVLVDKLCTESKVEVGIRTQKGKDGLIYSVNLVGGYYSTIDSAGGPSMAAALYDVLAEHLSKVKVI